MFPLTHHQYQCCHRQHLLYVPGTRHIEAIGAAVMAGAPITITNLRHFTQHVCNWGGITGNRVLWRIQATSDHVVLKCFNAAIVEVGKGDVLRAKNALNPIRGLGRFSYSYSSKHIRMLAPHLSAVLDQIVETHLKQHLPGASKAQLYVAYCDFCVEKAKELTAARVKKGDFINPQTCEREENGPELESGRANSLWLAADVDMACFAWLKGWCRGGTAANISTINEPLDRSSNNSRGAMIDERPVSPPPIEIENESHRGQVSGKRRVYLCQNHKTDQAVTLKEECNSHWNLGWICRGHGQLDFKRRNAWGVTRYLIGEIAAAGGNALGHPHYRPSGGYTCHQGGVGYQGGIRFGSVANAVRYLKQYFDVVACPCNQTETQNWINGL
jgi:hypothetical protein